MRISISKIFVRMLIAMAIVTLSVAGLTADDKPSTRPGYYRYPAIHGDTIIFTAEGDLWSVSAKGGAVSEAP